ncbi:type IV pilin [Haloarchaeobius sp. DFWS5]|uniref:type IV pilin n=1 Tax=Haloarchaeobius sp. DFWS5 TaxID=3446114 RepID=UPI003EBB984C
MLGDRGATSPVAVLLMVAVALVMVAATGVFVFDAVPGVLQDPPQASVDVTVEAAGGDAQTLVLAHQGGDELPVDEAVLVVDDGGTSTRIPLSSFSRRSADTDGRLVASEVLGVTHLLSNPSVTVRLVHDPSNTVIGRQTLSTGTTPTVADFELGSGVQSFATGNQDRAGESTVEDGGATVTMRGNQWKYVDYSYTVTEDTMLAFDFRSDSEGDIHGIGFETDTTTQSASRVVQVAGIQNWGENVSQFASAEYYAVGDGWVRYEVPIGELYRDNGHTGSADYLLFVTDCDPNGPSGPVSGCPSQTAGGDPTAGSQFRNVHVYENSTATYVVADGRMPARFSVERDDLSVTNDVVENTLIRAVPPESRRPASER